SARRMFNVLKVLYQRALSQLKERVICALSPRGQSFKVLLHALSPLRQRLKIWWHALSPTQAQTPDVAFPPGPPLRSSPRAVLRLVICAAACLPAAFCLAVAALAWQRAEFVSPQPTPIIEDRNGNFLTEGHREQTALGFWDVTGPLNPKLVMALTAIEDRRF